MILMAEAPTDLSESEVRVWEWRKEQLIRAGLDAEDAELLARHWTLDWHMCEELLKRGCTPTQLLRIVL